MRPFLFCHILYCYIAAVAASDCWSPAMPGPASCSVCTQDELRGSQCVRSGRWFTCYTSAELCCKDGEVLNHSSLESCIADANKGETTHGVDENNSDNDGGDWDESKCQEVASRSSDATNRQCMSDCATLLKKGVKPRDDTEWSQSCMTAHWHAENGRTVPDGPCFQKWVYGYSEPNNLASFKMKLEAETPALCQALCQEDDDCVNWLWVSPLYAPGTEVAKRCMLKSKAMVEKPLSMITETQPPTNLDVDFCNYQMGYTCQNLYQCLKCDGDRRCVWESDMHISGWKYCDHDDLCVVDSTPLYRPTYLPPINTTYLGSMIASDLNTSIVTIISEAPFQRQWTTPRDDASSLTASLSALVHNATQFEEVMSHQSGNPSPPAVSTSENHLEPSTADNVATVPAPNIETSASSPGSVSTNTVATAALPHIPKLSTAYVDPGAGIGDDALPVTPVSNAQHISEPQVVGSFSIGINAPISLAEKSTFIGETEERSEPVVSNTSISSTVVMQPDIPRDSIPTSLLDPTQAEQSLMPSQEAHSPTSTSVECSKAECSTSLVGDECPDKAEPSKPQCRSESCGYCSCCGERECGCCKQSGIVLKINERPKHLHLEVQN